MNNRNPVHKYCAHYAECEVQQLGDFPSERQFTHVIMVPAYNERSEFLNRLQTLAQQNGQTLVILVINQPDNDPDVEPSAALLHTAQQSGELRWQNGQLGFVEWQNRAGLLTVDRFTAHRRIPRQQGVGLARKIGCDIAVALHIQGVLGATFIHTTDADAILPADYLRQTAGLSGSSAMVFPFQHCVNDDPLGQATRLYEESLRYYVDGLQWAGSPYAFHTIGSCLAISLHHYCLARGFPKRAGGEDFYLLNKLAKLAPVTNTVGSPIRLQARRSSRVPFGTGPAVGKILQLPSPANFKTYDPQVFVELATLLRNFQGLSQTRLSYQRWLASLDVNLQNTCIALNIERLFRHLSRQVYSEAQCQRHVHGWFDAFRTLKFIHHLQQHGYPPVSFSKALEKARQLWR